MTNKLPILFDVPALEIDRDRSIRPQGRVDRRVVWNVLHALAVTGFVPVRVDETDVQGSALATMELVFNLDEARVTFQHPNEAAEPWAFFVLGNDGPDALSNYTTGPVQFAAVLDTLDFERMV